MRRLLLSLPIIISLIIACNPQKQKLKNRWVLMEHKGSISPKERKNLISLSHFLPIKINDFTGDPLSGSFVQFSSFGKYNLRLNTIYSQGKWIIQNDSTILMVSSTYDSIPMRIVSIKKDTLEIYFITGHSFANYLSFLAEDKPVKFITDTLNYFFKPNPYSYTKNQWALKADHHLTEKEIRNKLVNYIDYLIIILRDERDNSKYLDKITNPVQIASNGIALVHKSKVDPEWQNIFYDQEGFEKAYQLLQNTFKCRVNMIKTTDFTELDADILEQIKEIVESGKICE